MWHLVAAGGRGGLTAATVGVVRMINGAGRWVLLLALAAGLVGMHHLEAGVQSGHVMPAVATIAAAPPHPAGPVVSVDAGMDGMEMAMHLCLAVLAAVGLLGLLLFVVAVLPHDPAAPSSRTVVRAVARPPPRSAVRLALLCVLRN